MYLRRLPQLPTGWLRDEHLVALRALSTAPGKFADIQAATELSENALARTLAALYYAGAITTKKGSAGFVDRSRSPVGDQSSLPPNSGMVSSNFSHAASVPPSIASHQEHYAEAELDRTAPAPFMLQPRRR